MEVFPKDSPFLYAALMIYTVRIFGVAKNKTWGSSAPYGKTANVSSCRKARDKNQKGHTAFNTSEAMLKMT